MVADDLLYTKEHEWVRLEADVATVGITDYAQKQLGDIVYVELPSVGAGVEQMKAFGTVEAVKAVSDLFAPVSGVVTAANEALAQDPSLIKSSPYGDGWMIKEKISNSGEIDRLMKAAEYRQLVGE